MSVTTPIPAPPTTTSRAGGAGPPRRPLRRRGLLWIGLAVALVGSATTAGFAAGLAVTSQRLTTFANIAYPPRPSGLLIANRTTGGEAGKPEEGDTVTVTFTKRLAVSSICSSWAGDGSDQSITAGNAATVHVRNNAAASGNDLLEVTVTASTCATFRFGQIDLGSPALTTQDATFQGGGGGSPATRVEWKVASRQLIVTLGNASTGGGGICGGGSCPGSVTATYTPTSGITDTAGTGIIGTASRTAVQF